MIKQLRHHRAREVYKRLLVIVRGRGGQGSHAFELAVQFLVLASLVILAVETMQTLSPLQRALVRVLDGLILFIFLGEYLLRIAAAPNKRRYLFSFWGIIDFLAVVPTILIAGFDLKMLRAFLFLRLIRLLKLGRYAQSLDRLVRACQAIVPEFTLFFGASMVLLYLASAGIYVLERQAQPEIFSSIPAAMWWAVATFTTVGYGDAYPITAGGKIFASMIIMLGLCLVGIPAGLIAAALIEQPDHLPAKDGENDGE